MTRILITGGSGYLGAALCRLLQSARPQWETHATFSTQPPLSPSPNFHHLDLRAPDSVARLLHSIQPQVIVHTAAQMQGTLAELRAVNAAGSAHIARRARELNARLIHLSSDVIFDGRKGNYGEDDAPNPITAYAQSKYEAERAVWQSGAAAVIVRTSLIYGLAPLDPRTRALLDGTLSRLFTDEFRCPIWVEDLCAALVELSESAHTGILHVAGAQALSRYEFGTQLVRALGGDSSKLIATTARESGLVRPLDCTLDIARARELLKIKLLGVDEVIERLT